MWVAYTISITAFPLHSLDAHTLSPLLQFRNMEHITIDTPYGHAAINNSLLKELTLVWPCLHNISLHLCHNACPWHSKANLQGLTSLTQHCHLLQSVSLQFDDSFPTATMYLDKGICCESLTQLDISHSPPILLQSPLSLLMYIPIWNYAIVVLLGQVLGSILVMMSKVRST